MKSLLCSRLVLSCSLLCITISLCSIPLSTTQAQVQPPANTSITSSGLNTDVSAPTALPNGKVNYDITGGTRPGGGPNLFHSFGEFSVATNHIANFLNETALPTSNIIGRINGGQVSNIWGTIQTTGFGAANLYLTNPSGFIFGPTASLNVGGSFAAATADYLRMSDGALFHTDPAQPSVLSIANVAAFGFTNPRPVAIALEGSILRVATQQTLSIFGGDITMTGGSLTAPGGRIQIASVASSGEVVPSEAVQPPTLDVSSFTQLGSVAISGTSTAFATLSVSSLTDPTVGAGTVLVRANQLTANRTAINATTGTANAAPIGIDLQVTDKSLVTGSSIVTTANGTGRAGDIRIKTDTLQLDNSIILGRAISGTGDGGAIDVSARLVDLRNNGSLQTFTQTGGRAGNITVRADRLEARDGGSIFSGGLGTGSGGDIDVAVKELFGSAQNLANVPNCAACVTGIQAQAGFGSRGGSVHVQADSIQLLDGAGILSQLFSTGPGANIDVTANNIVLSGLVTVQSPSGPVTQFSSIGSVLSGSFAGGTGGNVAVNAETIDIANNGRIVSILVSGAPGNAGNIHVTADALNIHDRGGVFASSFLGTGNSGDISINADTVTISGLRTSLDPGGVVDFTGLSASTATGRGGTIRVTTNNDLLVTNKGAIASTTFSSGSAGSISIQAHDVSVTDAGFIIASTGGSGAGGSIDINANRVAVSGEVVVPGALDVGVAAITAQAKAGSGNAGTIKITADEIDVLNKGIINNDTLNSGQGGTIELNAASVRVANGGEVTAASSSTGAAGSIMVNAKDVTVTGVANSPDPFVTDFTGFSVKTVNGTGGSMSFVGDNVSFSDKGSLTSATTGMGNAGSIIFQLAKDLNVTNGSSITASTSGGGVGGSINVLANQASLATGGTITASTSGPGNAGIINITTGNMLTGHSGSIISSSTTSSGEAGQILIATPTLTMNDSDIITNTEGTGNAGIVEVNAKTVTLMNGADIKSNTTGAGNGGTVKVTATESLSLTKSDSASFDPTLITLTAGSGNAGNIIVTTPNLTLQPGSVQASTGPGTSGNGGTITLNVRNATLGDGGRIFAETFGSGRGGSILLQGLGGSGTRAELVDVRGTQASAFISASTFGSGNAGSLAVHADTVILEGGAPSFVGLAAQVSAQASGSANAGSLTVDTGTLELRNGAQINAGVFAGSGRGGNIDVSADTLTITGRNSQGFSSGISSALNFPSNGIAGNIMVATTGDLALSDFGQINVFSGSFGNAGSIDLSIGGNLSVTNGALISSANFGAGAAGDINVTAKSVLLQGPTTPPLAFTTPGIFTLGGVQATRAGNLTLKTGNLDILDGAMLIARTNGPGPGGTIDITADRVTISGSDPNLFMPEGTASGIYAGTRILNPNVPFFVQQATGNAGNITIRSGLVDLANRGTIEALSDSAGNGGTITLMTPSLNLASNATITAQARRGGNAGNINLNVGSLLAQSAAQITSSSVGTAIGRAGSITIQGVNGAGSSAQSVSLAGANTSITSDTDNTGRGGDIQIHAGQIQLADLASLRAETSGTGRAGSITVNSDNLSVTGGARIEASTQGVGNAGNITITNTDTVSVSGLSSNGSTRSGIFAKTQTSGGTAGAGSGGGSGGGGGGSGGGASGGGGGQTSTAGSAGNVGITTKNLLLSGGAQIDGSTTTAGAGGSVTVNADAITITGTSTRLTSDASQGNGTGGDIAFAARTIGIHDKASVTAATDGTGYAGNISMTANESFTLDSAATVTTSTRGSGRGGTILINSPQFLVDGLGTSITADTLRPFADLAVTLDVLHPNDGDLTVRLDSPDGTRLALLSRVGSSGDNFTGTIFDDQATQLITSGSAPFTGTFRPREPLAQLIDQIVAGTWKLNVSDQAATNTGSLQSWSLRVGDQVFQSANVPRNIPGNGSVSSNLVVTTTAGTVIRGVGEAPGIGGDVTINAGTVTVQNGATMSATTRGSGQGGTLTVNATGPVSLSGPGSGLFTDSEASGGSGNINVAASRMTMDNGATVSAASSSTGDAGTITINAGSEFLSTNSSITTESLNASGGNITLLATDMIHLKNSQITASVLGGPMTVGGNILIDPNFIILQNSQIIAQAIQGAGGNINLTFNQAFLRDARSVVSASSQFGVNGTVNINSPSQNLSGALVPLEQSFLSGNTISNQRCAARMAQGQISTFIVTEREGLPQEPGGMLLSSLVEIDGTAASETIEPIRVASVSQSSFTPLTPEPVQLTWTDDTCRR